MDDCVVRGATPTHVFDVDTDLTGADVISLVYVQRGRIVLKKEKNDMTVTAEQVSVSLTQEETLKFCEGDVEMQMRARFPGSSAIKSSVCYTTADVLLEDGEI